MAFGCRAAAFAECASKNRPVLSSVAKRPEKIVVGMTAKKKRKVTENVKCVSGETEFSNISVYYVALLAFLTTSKE